jgi:outer membrane protein assembly factor BamE
MPAMPPRRTLPVLAVFAFAALLAGCGSVDSTSRRIASAFTPYKIEIVQGNFVSKEQVQALRPGMSREQVRQILGTPLVTSLFHAERWDYVFTLKRQGVDPQQRRLTVFFKGEGMDHFEGDTMPSESEFVATLERKRATGTVPPLEATEAQLRAFPAKPAAPVQPAPAAAAVNYPPLEAPAR